MSIGTTIEIEGETLKVAKVELDVWICKRVVHECVSSWRRCRWLIALPDLVTMRCEMRTSPPYCH